MSRRRRLPWGSQTPSYDRLRVFSPEFLTTLPDTVASARYSLPVHKCTRAQISRQARKPAPLTPLSPRPHHLRSRLGLGGDLGGHRRLNLLFFGLVFLVCRVLSARLQAVLPTVIGTDESREPSDDELDATVAAIATAPTVALCGFTRLDPCFQREFARHAMFKRNHAAVKRSAARMDDESAIVAVNGEDAVAPAFKVPDPSDENYVAGCLNGATVVMSGTFDFVENSGVGLTQGKSQLKAILESFGARVTTSISKKTTFLLVGNEPGACKLEQCNRLNVKLVSPKLLLAILARGHVHPKDGEDDDPLPVVGTLSCGFGGGKGRSVANLTMDEKESIGLSKCQRIA